MIDFNKEVTTRDGRRVVLLSVDGPDPFPIVGYVVGREFSQVLSWEKSGKYGGFRHSFDLVQAPDAPLSDFGKKRLTLEAAGEMLEVIEALATVDFGLDLWKRDADARALIEDTAVRAREVVRKARFGTPEEKQCITCKNYNTQWWTCIIADAAVCGIEQTWRSFEPKKERKK